MSKEKKNSVKKSYESDGIMGEQETKKSQSAKNEKKKVDDPMFFNITEMSE